MDNLPNGGKVVIVDDCFQEILPLFNINQSTFLRKEVIEKIEVYFTLHRKYYLKLRQALVTDFSKQGLDLYGAH